MPFLYEIIGDRPLFVTRWWGFRPDRWASVSFLSEGTVDRWIADCPEGGFVLGYASHHPQEQLSGDDRGNLFGVYEFVPEKIRYDDPVYIHPDYLQDPSLRRQDLKFRWPFGLRAIRAWRFDRPWKTGGTLPKARSYSYEATTSMVPIENEDWANVRKKTMVETQVYNQPPPMRAASPVAIPGYNYVLWCDRPEILMRIPGWRREEVLIKPGIAFDVSKRLDFLNGHAIAQIFGLALKEKYRDAAQSFAAARGREQRMIAAAIAKGYRVIGNQKEFLLGNPRHLDSILAVN